MPSLSHVALSRHVAVIVVTFPGNRYPSVHSNVTRDPTDVLWVMVGESAALLMCRIGEQLPSGVASSWAFNWAYSSGKHQNLFQ